MRRNTLLGLSGLFFVLAVFSLMWVGFDSGLLQMSVFNVSSDGKYFYGDSALAVTGNSCVLDKDGVSKSCNGTYWRGLHSVLSGNDKDLGVSVGSVTFTISDMGAISQKLTVEDGFVRSVKDFKEADFKAELESIPRSYRLSSGATRYDSGMILVSLTDGVKDIPLKVIDGGVVSASNTIGIATKGSFELRHQDLNPDLVDVFWNGVLLQTVDVSGLSKVFINFYRTDKVTKLPTQLGYVHNARYGLLVDCTLRANQAFVADYVDAGTKLGVGVDSLNFGLSYTPAKFCNIPSLMIMTNPSGVKVTTEIYDRLISGGSFTIPDGASTIVYYPVDCTENPEMCKCGADKAWSEKSGLCIPFVMTGAGSYDPESGNWGAETVYVNQTQFKTVTEVVTKTVQCTVDDDCATNLCKGGQFTCDTLTNKCVVLKQCDVDVQFGSLKELNATEKLPISESPGNLKEPVSWKYWVAGFMALLFLVFAGIMLSIAIKKKRRK